MIPSSTFFLCVFYFFVFCGSANLVIRILYELCKCRKWNTWTEILRILTAYLDLDKILNVWKHMKQSLYSVKLCILSQWKMYSKFGSWVLFYFCYIFTLTWQNNNNNLTDTCPKWWNVADATASCKFMLSGSLFFIYTSTSVSSIDCKLVRGKDQTRYITYFWQVLCFVCLDNAGIPFSPFWINV